MADASYTEIASGLTGTDVIVQSASASLADGHPVVAVTAGAGKQRSQHCQWK
jgi:hypothetical protein